MLFPACGRVDAPTIILLHGGGLSDWSVREAAERLASDFRVVTPIIDGHGADADTEFTSIENAAMPLIGYIDNQCHGQVYALAGLSLGAQIVVETISRRPDIARYAILESALVLPIRGMAWLAPPIYTLFHGLIKQRWFSRMQAKALMLPESLHARYYQDSRRMSRKTLIHIATSNAAYRLNPAIAQTTAKVLVIVGERELPILRTSAQRLVQTIPESQLYCAAGMKHGELSLVHPDNYVALLRTFFAEAAD